MKSTQLICMMVGMVLFPFLSQAQSLSGTTWQLRTDYGTSTLVFQSDNVLLLDGEAANYSIVAGALRVDDGYGAFDYPFLLQDDVLQITFPDGMSYPFVKVSAQTPGQEASPPTQTNQVPATPSPVQAEANAWQLQGSLCSWSGSSSSYSNSSYSRTQKVQFDGQGNFVYGSEASFGSDDGIAYGGGSGERGTYRIQGDQVILTFQNGEVVTVRVYVRQNNGRITELMYGETLFATGLCE